MTKIEWCDEVWNPVTGCTPVSAGCDNCYAKRMATRLRGRCGYPKDDPFAVTFHEDRLEIPWKWKKPRRIFVNSMGDLFHQSVKWSSISAVYREIVSCDWHTFLVLTKRPQDMLAWRSVLCSPPVRNLWLGVSVENEDCLHRIDDLRKIDTPNRFVSFEPLLGPVTPNLDGIAWVIVGGETGPGARLMKPEWAGTIYDECQKMGIQFFFKSRGSGAPGWPGWPINMVSQYGFESIRKFPAAMGS